MAVVDVLYFSTAEQLNKDIPNQVQVTTYKMTEFDKTLSALTESQIPKLHENVSTISSHVRLT